MKKLIIFILIFFTAVTNAYCAYGAPSFYELVGASDLVIHGTIDEVKETTFILRINEVLAGEFSKDKIEIHQFVNWTCSSRWALYEKGQEVIAFIDILPETDSRYKISKYVLGSSGSEGEIPIIDNYVQSRGVRVYSKESKEFIWESKFKTDLMLSAIRDYKKLFDLKRSQENKIICDEKTINEYKKRSILHQYLVETTMEDENLNKNESSNDVEDEYVSVSGRVFDKISNKGIKGVKVEAVDIKGRSYREKNGKLIFLSDKTDSNGNYKIVLSPGPYELYLESYSIERESNPGFKTIIMEKSRDLKNYDFKVRKIGSISGKVYDTDGVTPLKNAEVGYYSVNSPSGADYTLSTDKNGYFKFDRVKNYDSWKLAVSFRATLFIHETPISVQNAEDVKDIKIIVRESSSKPNLHGTVKDKMGNRPSNLNVVRVDSINNPAFAVYVRIDKDCNYSFYGLPTDTYIIMTSCFDTTLSPPKIRYRDYETMVIYETSHIKRDLIYEMTKGKIIE